MPSLSAISFQRTDVNWGPLSEVISNGTPKRDIQCLLSVFALSEVDVLLIGMASGQRVVLSMMLRRYEYPSEGVKDRLNQCVCE